MKRRVIEDTESDSDSDVVFISSTDYTKKPRRVIDDEEDEEEILIPRRRVVAPGVAVPGGASSSPVFSHRYSTLIQTLFRDGVVTVPCIEPSEVDALHAQFLHVLRTLPELRDDKNEEDIVPALGGFGALGLPSSFHHPFIRRLRSTVYDRMVPFFQQVIAALPDLPTYVPDSFLSYKPYGIEQLIDRVQLRQPGTSTTPESFHRDTSVYGPGCNGADGDVMFGGWLNLDSQPQFFSCVKGTHKPGRNDGHGFSSITDASEKKAYKEASKVVTVPPGEVIIFFSNIVHEVLSRKQQHISARQYQGWRLTPSPLPLFNDLDERLDRQTIIQLPSSQEPPMFASLHWNLHPLKLQAWCEENLAPSVLVDRQIQSGARQGTVLKVVPRFLHQPLGLLYYPVYTPEERSKHKPHFF